MTLDAKAVVWNRAALEHGGKHPRIGDQSLTDALKVHGLVMNGGVHHAVEALSGAEVGAAIAGFEYFGFPTVGDLLKRVQKDSKVHECSDADEDEANHQYWQVLPGDAELFASFETRFGHNPADFGPVNDTSQAV